MKQFTVEPRPQRPPLEQRKVAVSDQHQFSPHKIDTLSRQQDIKINK